MRWLHLIALCAVVGCSTPQTTDRALMGTCTASGDNWGGVPYTAEETSNTLDLIDNATLAELIRVDGVGEDAARQIAAGRPWFEFPEPLDAVAQLPAVDEAVLVALRDHTMEAWCLGGDGRQSCCIETHCAQLGGWVGSVDVLDWEATAVLEWANNAHFDELERVCGVGPGIAADIIAARPMRDLKELDAVPYVGPVTLQNMLGREGFECDDQGSVFAEWCALDGMCECALD